MEGSNKRSKFATIGLISLLSLGALQRAPIVWNAIFPPKREKPIEETIPSEPVSKRVVVEPEVKIKPEREKRLSSLASYIGKFEGIKDKVYDPNPCDGIDEPTIGIGHSMLRGKNRTTEDSRSAFRNAVPEVNYEDVFNGRVRLTTDQIERLFRYDVDNFINTGRRLIKGFDELPDYLQEALVNGFYRGDVGRKTIALINEGDWDNAAIEYLDRKDYRTAVRKARNAKNPKFRGMFGIIERMEENRDRMLRYASELRNSNQ